VLTNLLFFIREKRWFFVAVIVAILMYFLPHPKDLSTEGYHAIIIIVITIILIIKEPLPLPAIAILMIFLQVLFGIASANEVASAFMNDAVFFIMGSLMLAVAIVSQGLDKRLALGIIKITGNQTWKIVAGFTAISALLSSFIGGHTVTAMMMPVSLTLIRYASKNQKKIINLTAALLFSVAYGATIGSIGTPSGGGRNAIVLNYLTKFSQIEISYLKWMAYAYPMLLLEIPFTIAIILFTFRPEKTNLDSAVRRLSIDVKHSGSMKPKEYLAIILFILVFLGWVFFSSTIGLGMVALMGVFAYLAFDLVEWNDLNKSTNWGVVLLFGAAISIGIQVKNTGAALWLANHFVEFLSIYITDLTVLRATIAIFLTSLFSNLLSSSATVAVVAPVVLNLGGDLVALSFATAISSAFGYFTAVAAPACAIIYSSGLVKSKDFLRAGWKMGIMSIILLVLMMIFWWPLLG
jgi:solute carrier family 13 (sodium-dependent dicarboxylate transporter), member 2/3/5